MGQVLWKGNTMPERNSTHEGKHCRVLLAEDCPDSSLLLTHMLKEVGADVVTAKNGKECVDTALSAMENESPFDVILMDIQMPVLDGNGATRILRRSGYKHPIVAMTARSTEEDRRMTIDSGCDDYINKLAGQRAFLESVKKFTEEAPEEKRSLGIPAIAFVPRWVKEHPEHCEMVLMLLDRVEEFLDESSELLQAGEFKLLKEKAVPLGAVTLYGYTVMGKLLEKFGDALQAEQRTQAERILPQLKRAGQAMLAGRSDIRKAKLKEMRRVQ